MYLFDYRSPHVGIKNDPRKSISGTPEGVKYLLTFPFHSVMECPCQYTFPLCLLLDMCANADGKPDAFGLLKNSYYSNFSESV